MAEVSGPSTIQQRALPLGVDGTKLAQWMMREGISFQEFVNRLSLAVGAANESLATKWGGLMSFTTDPILEYPDGGSVTQLPEITDLDIPDQVRGETIGHHIDLKSFGGAVGGSWMFWRDARPAQIASTIATTVNRGIWRFEVWLLTRAFTGVENAIGTGGYDVPFVHGTGGAIDFTPPAYAGQTFTTSHDHLNGVASGLVTLDAQLNNMAAHLEEHGHEAPYRAIVARADIALYTALTKFVQLISPAIAIVDRGSSTTGAQFYVRGQPIASDGSFGGFQSDYGLIELYASARVPTGYSWLYKTYGQLDNRNPLKVRLHPDAGFGFYIVPEASGNDQWPIKRVVLPFEFGVSVGQDRTNGTVVYRSAGGTWADPAIS